MTPLHHLLLSMGHSLVSLTSNGAGKRERGNRRTNRRKTCCCLDSCCVCGLSIKKSQRFGIRREPNIQTFWALHWVGSEKTHLLCKGKYYCTDVLQFDWSGFSGFTPYQEDHIFIFGSIPFS